MNHFKFELRWASSPGGVHELQDHTFAYLRVLVRGKSILTVLDKGDADATRDWVLVPLYPLAEWITSNWWRLVDEPETPQRGIQPDDYLSCHSLRHADTAYAFPDVRLIPEGEDTRIEWHQLQTRHQNVDFIAYGEDRLPRSEIQQGLEDVVRQVLTRLDAYQITDTSIHRDWEAISGSTAEEVEFARAAAWLGLDPYETDDATASTLVGAWASVPETLREDLFQATTVNILPAAVAWVRQGIDQVEASTATDGSWVDIRRKISPTSTVNLFPWDQGYQVARQVRADLGLPSTVPFRLEDVLETSIQVIDALSPPSRSLEAIIAPSPGNAICCYTAKSRKDSRRFIAARAAMGLLVSPTPYEPTLLTPAHTGHQQRNRAFAAELLAPASLLRARIHYDEVNEDELQDLAGEFEVSTEVVRRQIQNHGLARLALVGADNR